jgi:hypothetical protein
LTSRRALFGQIHIWRNDVLDDPKPPFPDQPQDMPGRTDDMSPRPTMVRTATAVPAGSRARRRSLPAVTAASGEPSPSLSRARVPTC